MTNVVAFPGCEMDEPTEETLRRAADFGFREVTVVGYTQEGDLRVVSSQANGLEIFWHLSRALHKLHVAADAED